MAKSPRAKLLKFRQLFEFFSIAARPQLKAFCQHLPDALIKLFTSIAYNAIYNQQLPIGEQPRNLATLRRHKRAIKQLAHNTSSLAHKRSLLRKTGHLFLPSLINPVLDHLDAPSAASKKHKSGPARFAATGSIATTPAPNDDIDIAGDDK